MLALKTKTIRKPTSRQTSQPTRKTPVTLTQVVPRALVAPALSGSETDDELVALAQGGNQRAFEMLVRKYQRKVVQLVGRLVGDGDAPDVAQETFIKAYRALKNFRGQSAFYTWLYRIGVNTAKNHLVSRGRRPSTQDIDVADAEQFGHTEQLSDVGSPEAMLLSGEIKQKIFEVIGRLPADLRKAITLREIEGLSYEEIAEVMGCPIGTVRSRIFRARDAIDGVVQPLMAA